jgi:hypothetical protein
MTEEIERRLRGTARVTAAAAAGVALAAAAFGAFYAFLLMALHCDETPPEDCGHQLLAHVQFWVAFVGCVAAVWAFAAACTGRGRAAATAFGAFVAIDLAWFAMLGYL